MKRDPCLLLLAPAVLLSLFLVLAEGGLPRSSGPADRPARVPGHRYMDGRGCAHLRLRAARRPGRSLTSSLPNTRQLDRLLGTACTGQARSAEPLRTFGFGLRSLWLVDGLLFISLFLIGLSALDKARPARAHPGSGHVDLRRGRHHRGRLGDPGSTGRDLPG